jgi:addiction module HigA family antidote
MHGTNTLDDLKLKGQPPNIRLHKLKGDRKDDWSVTIKFGCSPRKINEIVNGKRAISPQFAIQLEKILGTTAEMWVHIQAEFDLWLARKNVA